MTRGGVQPDLQDALLVLQEEIREAKLIFDRVLSSARRQPNNVHLYSCAEGTLNGDLVIAAESATGTQWFLLGDFTGHGLGASIGTLFASQVFTAMVAKAMTHGQIVKELNRKLRQLLPTGRFMAAAVVSLDPGSGRLEVWNGALPCGYVIRPGQGIVHRIVSRHPPLGVIGNQLLELDSDVLELHPGDRLVLMTDGLVESMDAGGGHVSSLWVQDVLLREGDIKWFSEALLGRFEELALRSRDDISLLEVICPDRSQATSELGGEKQPGLRLCFDGPRLRDPRGLLASVFSVLNTVLPMSEDDQSRVAMVITELFTNAMDHGLLVLDSKLKAEVDGMTKFALERESRLQELEEGTLTVGIERSPGDSVRICVSHDGEGFEPTAIKTVLAGNVQNYGRGLALVQGVCESLEYFDHGRTAMAMYRLHR